MASRFQPRSLAWQPPIFSQHPKDHGGKGVPYSVSQVPIAPREQEEAQASSECKGFLSLETLSGKEEFTDFCLPKNEARKTFNSSQLQGQLQWFTPTLL